MSEYLASDPVITAFTDYVSTMFGAPVVNVELSSNSYTHSFNIAVEEYSSFITQWAIKGNIANSLGLPSTQDFTQRWVSQNFEFAKSFSQAYSQQVGVGGTVPIRKAYITLTSGQQDYYLPDDIQVNEIMWQEPPAITRYLADPNMNPAWVNHEFGWGYMGYSYQYIVPVYYSIQLANATEMRQKIYRGDYTYKIRPAPEDTTRTGDDYTGRTRNWITIMPVPKPDSNGLRVWYFYKNTEDMNLYGEQDVGDYVNNPGTIRMDEIPYSAFNSFSKKWVKQFGFAQCKEILGRIRSKFSTLPIPGAEIQLDGESLVSEAQSEKEALKEYLANELDLLSIDKMIESDATNAENINRSLSFTPNKISLF